MIISNCALLLKNNHYSEETISPFSHQHFISRVASFDSSRWFAKPKVISPLRCAMLGWSGSRTETDTIICGFCHSVLTHEVSDVSGQKLQGQLASGHKPFCGWGSNPCPEEFCTIYYATSNKEALYQRMWDTKIIPICASASSSSDVCNSVSSGSSSSKSCVGDCVDKLCLCVNPKETDNWKLKLSVCNSSVSVSNSDSGSNSNSGSDSGGCTDNNSDSQQGVGGNIHSSPLQSKPKELPHAEAVKLIESLLRLSASSLDSQRDCSELYRLHSIFQYGSSSHSGLLRKVSSLLCARGHGGVSDSDGTSTAAVPSSVSVYSESEVRLLQQCMKSILLGMFGWTCNGVDPRLSNRADNGRGHGGCSLHCELCSRTVSVPDASVDTTDVSIVDLLFQHKSYCPYVDCCNEWTGVNVDTSSCNSKESVIDSVLLSTAVAKSATAEMLPGWLLYAHLFIDHLI